MDYSFLAQDATVTVQPSGGFRSFFRPITRFFPRFFPVPEQWPAANFDVCDRIAVPAGTLGRDANGYLTINGQTYCRPRVTSAPLRYGPVYYP